MKKLLLGLVLGCTIISLQGCSFYENNFKETYTERNIFFIKNIEFKELSKKQIYEESKNWHNNLLDYSSSRKLIREDERQGLLVIKGQAGLKYDNCSTCISRNMIKMTDESFDYIMELYIKDHSVKLVFRNVNYNNHSNNFYKDKKLAVKSQLKNLVDEYEFHVLNPEAQPEASIPM
ncbi:uncharacterized protein with TBP-like fold DUF4468 [Acinetobacter sp. BIGb0102]|uniref:DUF4468 domain-containing protein n=1 Tax=Acinetobacter sp. BIGb0102 TaxID=2485131 RepID=UPI000F5073C2|nr:DUF4468 domain-containing protein [Acinetobacter sp. BIGb0102]RPE28306.1 uncharacterized protein with TBP-like fold DUF4468 [Acinetobacter sp. BIGb0102]